MRRRTRRRWWHRARIPALALVCLVLTLEIAYRLVALPVGDAGRGVFAALPLQDPAVSVEAGTLRVAGATSSPRRAAATLAEPGLSAGPVLAIRTGRGAAPIEPAPAAGKARVAAAVPVPSAGPKHARTANRNGAPLIAVILDDMGYSPSALTRLIRMPGPLTLSFLPDAEATPPMLEVAGRHDFEIMLHLPMEPLGDANPGRQALLVTQGADEIRERVRRAIAMVPGAVGVNNHMGSRFTTDARGLEVVMDELRRHWLFFVDSRTNPASLAEAVAATYGIPTTGRNVFLDHDPSPAAIARQLAITERVASHGGSVIAIGHPYATTLAALAQWLPTLQGRGFRLARASEVVAARLCNRWGDAAGGDCAPGLQLVGGAAAVVPQ